MKTGVNTHPRSAGQASLLAIDIGGTTIKAALTGADGTVHERTARPTGAELGPDHVLRTVRDTARAMVAPGTLAAGVVLPGVVQDGVARYATNIGWHSDVPLRQLLADDLRIPVAVGHDVRAAGLAEAEASGHDDLLLVVLGTGVAAAQVTRGAVVDGASLRAGELGHIPVYPDGEPCLCGQRGCLEAYASAGALTRRYLAAGGQPGHDAARIVAARDDAIAARVWDEAIEALGLALATATLLLDPARIVLGGGLAGAGERLVAATRPAVARRLVWRDVPVIELARLGADAGLHGAALLARRAHEEGAGR